MTRRLAVVLAVSLTICAAACDKAIRIDGRNLLVLRGATLIDGTGGPTKSDAVIVIEGDRVLRVGTTGQYRFPADAQVLDLAGRYVTPGFIDTHVHSRDLPEIARTLLAFGITTIRSPADENGVNVRHRLDTGDLLGPTLIAGGKLIDHPANKINTGWGANVTTETEVRREVRRQAERGVDYIKVYMGMPPDLVRAAVDEAHRQGVKVIGHLHCTGWTEAAEAGIDALVHTGSEGPSWELVDEPGARDRVNCGDFGAYLRAWARWAPTIDLRGPRMEQLIRTLVGHRVEVNPTLVIIESLYWGDDPAASQRLEPSYAPAKVQARWGPEWERSNPFMRQFKLTADEWVQLKRGFETSKRMIRTFHERGVLITAGSDVGMPWITPGVSFHRELELLRSAGISASDVLAIGTRNGAKALGIENKVGVVAEKMLADLVVLTANPLEDIHATRAIDLVIAKGRAHKPAELLK